MYQNRHLHNILDTSNKFKSRSECGKYVEVEGHNTSLTKTTPPEAPSRKSLEEKINRLNKSQRKKIEKAIDELKED